MAKKKVEWIGAICYVCDETGKFYDENKKEIKPNVLVKKCEKQWRKFVLTRVAESHDFANKLLVNLEKNKEAKVKK